MALLYSPKRRPRMPCFRAGPEYALVVNEKSAGRHSAP
jgi:hypothetical protein